MKFIHTIAIAALVMPTATFADFSVSKPKPRTPAAQTPSTATPRTPARPRTPRAPRTPRVVAAQPVAATVPAGIDPAFVNETLLAAGFKTNFTNNLGPTNPTIETSKDKASWIISFKECTEAQRCGQMEFYTLWRVTNEVNVCQGWIQAVTNDPAGTNGKPTCYTLPTAANQLHVTMSTNQAAYVGLNLLAGDKAKARILAMVDVWTANVGRLSEGYEYMRSYCPRKRDSCATAVQSAASASPAPSVAPNPVARRRTEGTGTGY